MRTRHRNRWLLSVLVSLCLTLDKTGDDDFSFAIPGVSRFRVSTFKQRGSYSAVIRVISFALPQPSELHIPDAVMNLADSRRLPEAVSPQHSPASLTGSTTSARITLSRSRIRLSFCIATKKASYPSERSARTRKATLLRATYMCEVT